MSAEEQLVALKAELEKLKAVLVDKDNEAKKAVENSEAVERELKKMLKEEKEDKKASGGSDRVVYVAHSRKLEKFRGRPTKPLDPGVEDRIADAKAACQSKGLSTKDQAAYLIEHLGLKYLEGGRKLAQTLPKSSQY